MDESPGSSPFASAAAYYDRFRAPYAPGALDAVIAALALGRTARVLDLGCGPGTIAIPLSLAVGEVVAVDLDSQMLAEGQRLAAAQGRHNICWIQGRAEDVLPGLGQFHAAVLGQSLHWMDRDLLLKQLADAVVDGGGVAILDEGARRMPESWAGIAAGVAARYLGRTGRHPLKHPETDHEPSLRRSAHFSDFTVREFSHQITRDVASIVGCIYSGVGATREMFGDRAPAFEAELTQALLRFNPSGVFNEQLETAVFLAPKRRRP
ncbi:class I SAM-dependent methyltransferase [Phenylobacterium sp.]|uniref:class I SAM-dependent methyltransferase n=1 Tax=Phenylobacterium sp. TaxID=1871053 RepID=UPI003564BC71